MYYREITTKLGHKITAKRRVCNLTLVRVRPLWIFAVDSCVFFAFDRLYFITKMRNFKTMFDKPVRACYTVTVM